MSIQRKTIATETVLNYLQKSKEALSAVSLVEDLKNTCDKVTVYRVLERLENAGKVHRIMGVGGNTYYAACNGCEEKKHYDYHPHLQCKECGKVVCINEKVQLPALHNCKIESEHILLFGLCDQCFS